MLKRMDKALEQINLNDQLENEINNRNTNKSLRYDDNIVIVSVGTEQNNPSISKQLQILEEECE